MTGSITAGPTRLPLSTIVSTALMGTWDDVRDSWYVDEAGLTEADLADFLENLLEARGEFGRLLLVLADINRINREGRYDPFRSGVARLRIRAQLERCLANVTE